MRNFLHPEPVEERVVQSPAYIVMAAQIVQKHIVFRQSRDRVCLPAQKSCIARSHSVPGGTHCGGVIEHMAFRTVYRAEVRGKLFRGHHYFAKQKDRRTDDLTDQSHKANDAVYLREVAAIGSELLPDIGNRVNAYDVYAFVCKKQHIIRHGVEYGGICIVKIPLIGIKGCQYIFLYILKVSEITRSSSGEDLRDMFFIFIRDPAIGIKEVIVLIFRIACPCFLRPDVLLAGMIHDKIHTDGDPLSMAVICQFDQIFHRPQLRLDLAKAGYRVSAVAPAVHHIEKRHKVQIIDAALAQIAELFFHTAQCSGKLIHIKAHTEQIISFIPVRIFFPAAVTFFQFLAAACVTIAQRLKKLIQRLFPVGIERKVERIQFCFAAFKPTGKLRLHHASSIR